MEWIELIAVLFILLILISRYPHKVFLTTFYVTTSKVFLASPLYIHQ